MAPVGRIFKAFLHTAPKRRSTRIPSFEKTYDGRKPIPNEPGRQAPATRMKVQKYFSFSEGGPPETIPAARFPSSAIAAVVDAPDIPIQRQAASAASSPMSRKSDIFPPATVTSRAGPPSAHGPSRGTPWTKVFPAPFAPRSDGPPRWSHRIVLETRGNSGDRNRGDSGLRPLLSSKGPAPPFSECPWVQPRFSLGPEE
jgi:hypothetical protein